MRFHDPSPAQVEDVYSVAGMKPPRQKNAQWQYHLREGLRGAKERLKQERRALMAEVNDLYASAMLKGPTPSKRLAKLESEIDKLGTRISGCEEAMRRIKWWY